MVDSRITAMVVAVLSGFEKGLTVNINVCSKEGESASIAISEFTKDEARKLLWMLFRRILQISLLALQ